MIAGRSLAYTIDDVSCTAAVLMICLAIAADLQAHARDGAGRRAGGITDLTRPALPAVAIDCATLAVDVAGAFRDADMVFTGTLVKADNQDILTFRAGRIWKGPAGRDIVVYELEPPYVESFVFHEGARYLVFAKVLSAGDRRLAGLRPDDPLPFVMPRSCGSVPWPLALSAELDKIARSRKPRG